MPLDKNHFTEVLLKRGPEITRQWLELQTSVAKRLSATEQQAEDQNSREFIKRFQSGIKDGELSNLTAPAWTPLKELLGEYRRAAPGTDTPQRKLQLTFFLSRGLSVPPYARKSVRTR